MAYVMRVVREVAETSYRPAVRRHEDVIEDLGDEIATLAAHIHAATQRFLTLVARFDSLRGWEASGHRDCARWLAARTGLDVATARAKVRAARALARLPLTDAAMARGELSFSQVRALTRVATAENEGGLLDLARGATTAQLERLVRGWRMGSRQDEAERERVRHESRAFSVFPGDDGMYVVKGRLTPEQGAVLMRAIEAAADTLYREHNVPGAHPESEDQIAQRRADAVCLIAERALGAGFGSGEAGSCEVPVSGTRAERYQVVLHVDAATLSADGEPGLSELEDGTRVSAETSCRLSCDAGLVRVAQKPDGYVLDVGRKTRTIRGALRRALEARDRGCRFPGCCLRFTDAHHVVHWADGGATSLDNCVLLCRHHHRLVHEGGWRVEWWGRGRPAFVDPRGGTHFEGRWDPPVLSDGPVETLVQENASLGIRPDGWTASARWETEKEIPDEVCCRASKMF